MLMISEEMDPFTFECVNLIESFFFYMKGGGCHNMSMILCVCYYISTCYLISVSATVL